MKRDSDGYKNFVAMVREYCNKNYGMNLDDAGELKRLRKLLGEKLYVSTLQRIFLGMNKSQKRVNDTTLNILAEFMHFDSVDDCFCETNERNTKS